MLRRILVRSIALVIAACLWLPVLHLAFKPKADPNPRTGMSPQADELLQGQLAFWNDPSRRAAEERQMRATNPEWDFMGRTYLAWSLANVALRDPSRKQECLRTLDDIIADTLNEERANGLYYFLMPYAHDQPFLQQPPGSQFVDGEIALAIGMRLLVEDRPDLHPVLRARLARIAARMEASPSLSAESYPDECWTFCNAVAVDALKIGDIVDGSDHSRLIARWLAFAKTKLIARKSGLLVSTYTLHGLKTAGPQGSSIFMIVHCLQILDPDFARQQYLLARRELGREALGFGYATEWPRTWKGDQNVDSGAVIPGLDVSPGSTGMAALAAAPFGDRGYLDGLMTSVDYGAFPNRTHGGLRYYASNQVGDAVLLYALVQGPVWRRVMEAKR